MIRFVLKCLLIFSTICLFGANQTPDVTPILPPSNLPFSITIELADFSLPNGWHSGAVATWGERTLLITGRTNGLHGFDDKFPATNFPIPSQNRTVYVIDFKKEKVWQRSLSDPSSGLTQEQIDTLSVTSPQFYQSGRTLYITGGYGINSATGKMDTKSTLTAINVPELINWVVKSEDDSCAKQIRQTSHPLLQVTGGAMNQADPHSPTLLFFGQNFRGYYDPDSNGSYTNQVRTFRIFDNGHTLAIGADEHQPEKHPAYRRRDLNVVPIIRPGKPTPFPAYVALSGVFTKTTGIWTVPVIISKDGESFMPNPKKPSTFKQAMNNYASATAGLFSNKTKEMYLIIFGGMTFGYFENGVFKTDPEIPFTNEVTTIKIDKNNHFSQHLMDSQYPTILSSFPHSGNPLLFGAGAEFIPNKALATYSNEVLALDHLLNESIQIGYIVGGIQSTVPDTKNITDSSASPYIFKVTLHPQG